MFEESIGVENAAGEAKSYELGYLLSPIIAPEAVAERLERGVRLALTEASATVTGEDAPKMLDLAYPIRRRLEHKTQVFENAYFGAMRFRAAAEAAPVILAALRKNLEIIRCLLITVPSPPAKPPAARRRRSLVSKVAPPTSSAESVSPIEKTEAIDRGIEGLLAAAAGAN